MEQRIRINPLRAALAIGTVAATLTLTASPACAQSLIAAAGTLNENLQLAVRVAQVILIAASVLALLFGLAPMLWGQVKVKWIISSLVASLVFTLVPEIVGAFAV